MTLKDHLLNYLVVAKKDANKNDKGLISELRHKFSTKKIGDTAEFARKIAGFLDLLYYYMPELRKKDPQYVKVQPLCEYCIRLAEHKHKKHGTRRR
jgi:hypothetical protein